MHDVAVIGAGTAGCSTSYLLAKEGLDVALLDKSSGIKERIICTGVISKEAYDRFALPVEAVLREVDSFKIMATSGDCFHYTHAVPFANVIDREFFQKWLLTRTLEEGVTFLPGSHAEDLHFAADEVTVRYRAVDKFSALDQPARDISEIRAKMLVLATGTEFGLLEQAGLKGPATFLQGVQAEAEVNGMHEIEIYLGEEIAPRSFAWCVPLGHGKAKIGLTTERSSATHLNNLLQNPLLKEKLKRPPSRARFRHIPFGIAEKSYNDRILAVGDAAGQVKTTTGGGIYYGLIGSELAVETILEAFSKGDASEKVLKKYEKRWQKVLKPEIHAGIFMRKIYAAFDDSKVDLAINLANNDGIRPLILKKAKFDWQRDFLFSLLKKPIIQRMF